MLKLNILKIVIILFGMWETSAFAANTCLKGNIPSAQQFKEAEESIVSNGGFSFEPGKMEKNSNKLSLPENLRECREYNLSLQELGELDARWQWMVLRYPNNLDYVFNYKLIHYLFIHSM